MLFVLSGVGVILLTILSSIDANSLSVVLFPLFLIILIFVQQTVVPSALQLSAMASQMLIISPQLSLISALVGSVGYINLIHTTGLDLFSKID